MPAQTTREESAGKPVFRLIYRSHSLIDPEDRSYELASIFTTARQNNRGHEITGALMVADGTFVQALEGSESEVRALFAVICEDGRHDEVTVLEQTSAARVFGRWAMAEVSGGEGPDIRLVGNAKAGKIVAMGKDPSITPEQEQVLGFMRDAVGSGAGRYGEVDVRSMQST